ncbi:MAG: cupin domain-containing protein [Myxococcota bacterium]
MPERSPTDYRVRTPELRTADALHVSHPLNERSEIFMSRLSDRAGLSHVGISMARVPPGKESFALHVHTVQEEWIFVLSGEGVVQIGDEDVEVKRGDFVGFPPNGLPHVVKNPSTEDLVYLQGGDRRSGDRGRFPDLGVVAFQHDEGHMALIPDEQIELRPLTDWVVGP